MKPERTIILIDGSNFYFKRKDLRLHTLDFHFSAFTKFLAGNREVLHTTYFVGEVRTDGTAHVQKLYNNQQRLITRLKSHGIRYQFGYLLTSDGKYHEKRVDVLIAVAILVGRVDR
jgi:NYN domain